MFRRVNAARLACGTRSLSPSHRRRFGPVLGISPGQL